MARVRGLVLPGRGRDACGGRRTKTCACGSDPPGPPRNRELRPYANAPDDMRPFSKFTVPYYENYTEPGGIQRRRARCPHGEARRGGRGSDRLPRPD